MCCQELQKGLRDKAKSMYGQAGKNDEANELFDLAGTLERHCVDDIQHRVEHHAKSLVEIHNKPISEIFADKVAKRSKETWDATKVEAEAILGLT